jgi:adenylate kinase family enzyme
LNNSETIKHIHVFGASGSGSTTLGANISKAKEYIHLDTDNYLWRAQVPPFGKLRNPLERNSLLDNDLRSKSPWVLSGSLNRWGDFAIRFFDLVIFLIVPHEERMKRYISRYTDKFGNDILDHGHPLHKRFNAFKTWASSYDDGDSGLYSKESHEKWLKKLSCSVIRIEGIFTAEETLNIALDKISQVKMSSGQINH